MEAAKQKLYHFKEAPPAEAWEEISKKLEKERSASIHNRKNTRLIALGSSMAAVILIFVVNFLFLRNNNSSENKAVPAVSSLQLSDSQFKNNEILESIIHTPENQKLLAEANLSIKDNQKYITIEGPNGDPVRISPKAATLIVSADSEFPPKPVWNNKIKKWQRKMLTNNVAPTPTNLMEILLEASNSTE